MAQEGSKMSKNPNQLDERNSLESRSSSSNVVCLERMEDGNLGVPHLKYIRTCFRDILGQIWSADLIERQREGHQRDNSPASESVEEYENEIPNSHVNFVEYYDIP